MFSFLCLSTYLVDIKLTYTVINCLWPITLFQIYHKLGGLEILEICPGLWVFSFKSGAECQAAGTTQIPNSNLTATIPE